jgi:uncharacterized membrane protein YqjE
VPPDVRTNGVSDVDAPLGDIVNRISLNASALVREEIELAKAEMELKVKKLVRGAAVGTAAGFFLFLGLIFAFHTMAWSLNDFFDQVWAGFLITTALLFILAVVAGLVAKRLFETGAPPTPDMAIEEAKKTREVLEHPEVQQATGPDPAGS